MGKFTTLLCATGLAVTAAIPATAEEADTVLARVNGKSITLGHMISLQEQLPEQYKNIDDQRLFDGILQQLIQQAALADLIRETPSKATALGLENEVNAFLARDYMSTVGTAEISDEAVQARYDQQFGNISTEPEFNASHILVETEEKALELIAMLAEGADFATLAQEHSTGPSGPRGGELGWFGMGQMVPPFEQAVIALEDGAVSAPVETQFGWHVVKRNESRDSQIPGIDDVRGDIVSALQSEALAKAVDDAVANATIEQPEGDAIDPSAIRNVELLSE